MQGSFFVAYNKSNSMLTNPFTLQNKLHIILLEAESLKSILSYAQTYPLTAVLQIPSDIKTRKNGKRMNNEAVYLWDLSVGEKAKVRNIETSDFIKRRMLDMGLINGTYIEVLQKSPAGDPVAYFIRGAVIALRDEDTKKILVEKI